MTRTKFRKTGFSPEHERVLKETVIDNESGPGTILQDFETMLEYVKAGNVQVSAGQQLAGRSLPEINARLSRPLQLGLKRPQQKSFPHINGLYLLLRASGLAGVDMVGKKSFLVIDEEVYPAWQGLNGTERYATLLETWLLRGQAEIIGERDRRSLLVPDHFHAWMNFFKRIPKTGLPVGGGSDAEYLLRYMPGLYNLGLMELFGLIAVQHGLPVQGKGWCIEHIRRKPWGDALLALLYAEFFGNLEKIFELEDKKEVPFGVLQTVLRPYLPGWENNLFRREWSFRKGGHIFKVSLGRTWRRIAAGADETLDTLARAILRAVAFDNDHLYLFSYRNRAGALESVHHSYMDEGPWTSEVRIGEVPIRIGQAMTFLFDFGDNWKFNLVLEQVDPDMDMDDPVILEGHGEPPEQYPKWD